MIKITTDTVEVAPISQEVADAQAIAAKWEVYYDYKLKHTVTINNHKYAANKDALLNMRLAIDTLSDNETDTWIEDWGSFQTDKVEIGLALTKANQDLRTYRNTLFGTA